MLMICTHCTRAAATGSLPASPPELLPLLLPEPLPLLPELEPLLLPELPLLVPELAPLLPPDVLPPLPEPPLPPVLPELLPLLLLDVLPLLLPLPLVPLPVDPLLVDPLLLPEPLALFPPLPLELLLFPEPLLVDVPLPLPLRASPVAESVAPASSRIQSVCVVALHPWQNQISPRQLAARTHVEILPAARFTTTSEALLAVGEKYSDLAAGDRIIRFTWMRATRFSAHSLDGLCALVSSCRPPWQMAYP
jgi:hypothetical protein